MQCLIGSLYRRWVLIGNTYEVDPQNEAADEY